MKQKDNTIRIDKFLSSNGAVSRRGVEMFLKQNNVTSDGIRITQHGARINPKSKILINGKAIQKPHKVYFMINKPKGIISTASDEFGRKNVVSLIKTAERIFPIGRLDKDTHGLLLLTNDGELTNQLIHPRYHIPKIYQLTIKGQIFPPQIDKFEKGIELEDGMTMPAKLNIIQRRKDATICEVTIFEGKKRQIRRMCEALNLPLTDLQRIQFGPLKLDNLKTGDFRELSYKEIESLKNTVKQKSS